MAGKSIPFPVDVAACQTTMTYGGDVAASIAALIGNDSAFGEAFNLTGVEHTTWRKISEIYSETLMWITGVKPTFYSPQNSEELREAMGNEYQIRYDRLYNRIFDNSKLMKACNYKLTFTPIKEGVSCCLEEFLKSPQWGVSQIHGLRRI